VSISTQGDEQPLESLLDRSYIRSVIRYATMRTGFPVVDEDLEQEAMLRVLRAIRRIPRIKYPKAFVGKIVGDTVRDFWRKKRRLESLDSIPEQLLSYQLPLEKWLDRVRSYDELRVCLNQLPGKLRTAIELFYIEECSVSDLAVTLQFSHSAAKMTLLRGRQQLRKMLKRRMFI
jgi:RNA polymerase sigma-70 factor (ECF subfamily)